jgi:hypothetical protein
LIKTCQPNSVAKVTTIPAINTPIEIATKDLEKPKSNKKAATLPVQAPVIGKGIATKRTSPRSSSLSTNRLLFRVLENSHLKNRSNMLKRLKNLDTGPKKRSTGIIAIMLPNTDKKYAGHIDNFK